jgi:hypothetical protein
MPDLSKELSCSFPAFGSGVRRTERKGLYRIPAGYRDDAIGQSSPRNMLTAALQ